MEKSKTPYWRYRLSRNAETETSHPEQQVQEEVSVRERRKSLPAGVVTDLWQDLESIELEENHLIRNRVISGKSGQKEQAPFDVLRTRLLQTLHEKGWSRVAITSPSNGCGKTFVAANLAMSLARRENSRTVLMDMDLRKPGLAKALGVSSTGAMRHFLTGEQDAADFLLKVGENLVVGLNSWPESEASALLQNEASKDVLESMQHDLEPEVVLFDLPPALQQDDVLAFLPQVDGVLLVVGGGQTKATDVRKVEHLLRERAPLLGVILNRDEGYNDV
ncbi:MAG: CpsD/CapB family tyrosine-protein kinase [Rhodobacteraceae bacterium]|nr:CpsD/CapB family tyrosine-protein kinase [Paracoccaceae bacterium]